MARPALMPKAGRPSQRRRVLVFLLLLLAVSLLAMLQPSAINTKSILFQGNWAASSFFYDELGNTSTGSRTTIGNMSSSGSSSGSSTSSIGIGGSSTGTSTTSPSLSTSTSTSTSTTSTSTSTSPSSPSSKSSTSGSVGRAAAVTADTAYPQEVMDLIRAEVRPTVDPKHYQHPQSILDQDMVDAHKAIQEHIASPQYQERVRRIEQANLTGILIPAGGARLSFNMLVTLKVVREHFKCTLPVEVMWQTPQEMDDATWGSIAALFQPIRGLDISKAPHPVPGMHIQDLKLERYTGKVYSLLMSEFRHVLMLDADSMPTQNPQHFFAHPQYKVSGNLFWPDAWHGLVSTNAYKMFGLRPHRAQHVLFAGKGYTRLDTESGQLLIDRSRHLDVLEYLLWINSKPWNLVNLAWGDKDTFGIAFAVAGKAHLFSQVPVPPAVLFSWRPNMLLIKATGEKEAGWQLLGFLQHDSWGQPAFIHRTINKYEPRAEPWELELITAPMPRRWTNYFLAHENMGPTRGVPWDFVVPGFAVTELTLQADSPVAQWVYERGGSLKHDSTFPPRSANGSAWPSVPPSASCPEPDRFLRLWAMKESALPIDLSRQQQAGCMAVLESVLGNSTADRYRQRGWLLMPSMRYLNRGHMAGVPSNWEVQEAATPLPAWRPNFQDPNTPDGPFVSAVRAAYDAVRWAQGNTKLFPIFLT